MARIYRIQCIQRRERSYFQPAYFDNKQQAVKSLDRWVEKNMDDCSVQVFSKGKYGAVGGWRNVASQSYGVRPKKGARARRLRKR